MVALRVTRAPRTDIYCATWYRLTTAALNLLCAAGLFVHVFMSEEVDGRVVGVSWAPAVGIASFMVLGSLWLLDAWLKRSVFDAAQGLGAYLLAFLVAAPHDGVERPGPLVAAGIVSLFLAVAVALPLLIALWRATVDERDLRILTLATTMGFGAAMLVASAAGVVQYVDARWLGSFELTPAWVVMSGGIAWFGSMLLLRWRM